jgi:beta-mannosidase
MPYHSSSPFIGWGRNESMKQGDAHYWGVWWGMQPFEVYQKKVGRFMSEYGFQALPMMNTLKQISDSSVLNLNSLSIKSHQKHPTGFETIDTYMKRSYPIPEDFKKYVYVSQLLQRDGLKMAIEAHRKAMPYCMGTLYWQLNDCWPGISWSTIDFNDQPKAAYFETKKLYKDVLISVSEVEDKFQIYIVSDKTSDYKAVMTVAVKDFSGKVIFQKTVKVDIKKLSSSVYFSLLGDDLKTSTKNESYISVELKDSFSDILASATYCFAKPNELKLIDPQLKIELAKDKSFIQITSKSFVKDLFLFSNDTNFLPENNFVDVEPNVPLKIKLNLGLKFLPQIDHFSLFDLKH